MTSDTKAPERIWAPWPSDGHVVRAWQSESFEGGIEYVRADLVAPQQADRRDLGPTEIDGIGNYYGGLWIRQQDGKPEWCIENYSGHHWEPCPAPVFAALRAIAGEAQSDD